jgi:hypothetical protein
MLTLLAERLHSLTVGGATRHRNLDVFPLRGEDRPGPDYVLAAEAIRSGVVRVEEEGAAGVVARMLVVNSGARPVLVLDGELLVGQKQNRVVNASMLLPAMSTSTVPVSCVERGRWHASGEASSSEHFSPHRVRSSVRRSVHRSLRARGDHRSDQGEVWAEVGESLRSVGSSSPSEDLVRAYVDHRAILDGYERVLRPGPDWQGFVVAVGGRVTGGDLFDRAATLGKLWPKLMRAAALDAIRRPSFRELLRRESPEREEPDPGQVRRLLDLAAAASAEEYPSPGIGRDLRIESGSLSAAALVADDTVIHAGFVMAE